MALFQRLSLVLIFALLVGCGGSAGGFDETPDGSDGSTPDAITITLAISDNNLTQATPQTLTVNVMQGSTPLSDKLVTFTVSNTDLASFSTDVNTSSTDADGNAEIGLLAGASSGDGSVTANIDGIDSNSVTFKSAGDGSEEVGNALTITSFTNSTSISNANPANIIIHFEAANGIDLSNEVITFTSTLGLLDPKTGTVLTNSTGDATITLSTGTVRGAGVLTASSNAGDAVTQGFFTEGDGSEEDGNALTITSFTNSTSISNANPANIITHFEAANGTDLSNEVITFSSTLGVLDPITGTVLTNSTGDATITLFAGTVRGAGVLTVSSSAGDVVTQGFFSEGNSVGSGVNISLALTDSEGNEVEQISSISSGKLIATVTGVNKAVIVTFTTDLGTIPIQTAIATTGSDYIATVDLLAGNSLGAGTVIAQLASGESEQLVFSIGASSLGMGNAIDGVTGLPDGLIAVPAGVISAGATAGLSVSIWDVSNASASTPATLFTTETVEVSFTSGCSDLSVTTANIDSPVATIAGIAQSTYLAQGCQGPDIVTATANAGGTVLSATGTVTISSPDSGSIEFISATPENISLKGVGGIESSTVVFKVRDTNGNVVANKDVGFSLNTEVGGIGWSPKFAKTDSNGLVQTVVNSGTVHTSVRVRAELNEDASIFTQSNLLVISTGIPDQDSFSLSASVFNPEAWNIDGTEVTITARLADAFNNPAPDGTAVSFTTEGGAIEDSCVTTNGVCEVTWTSQNVRPAGQELGEANNGPTLVKSTADISKGFDFTGKTISFTVSTSESTDTITLNKDYASRAILLAAVNTSLADSDVKAVSGFEDLFELISPAGLDITIEDTSSGSVTTFDVLGITDGTTYYNDATQVLGLNIITGGKDFSVNDIKFKVITTDGEDIVTLNTDLTSTADLVNKVNDELVTSSVVASEFMYAGSAYLLLTSDTRLDIKITDDAGTNTTFAELGIANGTTFASRINNSSPSSQNFMGQKYGGRATISATAIGEESFPDFNGNGLYDNSEKNAFLGLNGNSGLDVNGTRYDLAESFVDYNEDGIYNPDPTVPDGERAGGETGGEQEKFDDFNSSGDFDLEDKQYNGSLCGDADNCSPEKSINVRGSVVLVMSGSNPRFVTTYPTNGESIDIVQDGTVAAAVTISDFHNQPMPAGTVVTFDAAVGTPIGVPSGGYEWPNTNFNGGSVFTVTIEGVKDKDISGPLVVTVTTLLGVATSYTVATINITSF
ncbi:hypothetical protein H4J51_15400 [Colwellia sp. MB02u-18]|uniref:beta strand repeat-containing protein n=1 Tax=unclassified Colwellia TaxID=196834 RepID=UPI0015F423F0|nr:MULTISPECIES: hypothetical protein [unclassified Colwellia]MBA6223959.1 hypothetical protein [Colwellia sp. MB3u-45]MBA6266134.1 hypothetical protein [Colwellia sp. MB3u-43]MBA6320140.1 hypothetical protein [Colwellia sp. MB02u-19]MBA6325951.1 hypothetical protein [Colwellia sp. MB02u-18]MBA6332594.1 hypothetical protein [Colwellia sp. MB02u-12]